MPARLVVSFAFCPYESGARFLRLPACLVVSFFCPYESGARFWRLPACSVVSSLFVCPNESGARLLRLPACLVVSSLFLLYESGARLLKMPASLVVALAFCPMIWSSSFEAARLFGGFKPLFALMNLELVFEGVLVLWVQAFCPYESGARVCPQVWWFQPFLFALMNLELVVCGCPPVWWFQAFFLPL